MTFPDFIEKVTSALFMVWLGVLFALLVFGMNFLILGDNGTLRGWLLVAAIGLPALYGLRFFYVECMARSYQTAADRESAVSVPEEDALSLIWKRNYMALAAGDVSEPGSDLGPNPFAPAVLPFSDEYSLLCDFCRDCAPRHIVLEVNSRPVRKKKGKGERPVYALVRLVSMPYTRQEFCHEKMCYSLKPLLEAKLERYLSEKNVKLEYPVKIICREPACGYGEFWNYVEVSPKDAAAA